MQEALGGQGEFPARLGQDVQALSLPLQDDAAEEALVLKEFHDAAGVHVGQKLSESP
jgi:hypothetical protein